MMNKEGQGPPIYLVARRKVKSFFNDPWRIHNNYIAPKLSGAQLASLSRRVLIPVFSTAIALSAAQEWSKLEDYVVSHEHGLIIPIARYLKHQGSAFEAKSNANTELANVLCNDRQLHKMSVKELLSASGVFTQFGLFTASAVCRYAAIGKLLAKRKDTDIDTRAAKAEIYGMDSDDLTGLSSLYKPMNQTFLKRYKKCLEESGFDVLVALKENSDCLARQEKERLSPRAYELFQRLRARDIDLTCKNILLVGPSARESEPVAKRWADVTMRIGYLGPSSISADEDFATGLSFYKNHKISDLSAEAIKKITDELDCFIVSGLKGETLGKIKNLKNVCYSRYTGRILLGAECNAGVEALLCALEANAQYVHIKNLDLFVNNLYPHGYKTNNYHKRESAGGWVLDDKIICRSMALNHAPIAQYNTFKTFWSQRKIGGDRLFEELMSEGLSGYLWRLESTYYPFKG